MKADKWTQLVVRNALNIAWLYFIWKGRPWAIYIACTFVVISGEVYSVKYARRA